MDADHDIVMAYGRSVYFESHDLCPEPRTGPVASSSGTVRTGSAERCRTATSCISSPEVVVRTSVQHEMGGYRPELTHAGDLEMWLRFASCGKVAFLAGVDQAYYRVHSDSMMRKQFSSPLVDLQQRKAAFDAVFDGARLACWSTVDRLRDRSDLALGPRSIADRLPRLRPAQARLRSRSTSSRRSPSPPTAMPTTLREYRGLQWRRRIGPRRTPWLPSVLTGTVAAPRPGLAVVAPLAPPRRLGDAHHSPARPAAAIAGTG